MARLSALQQFKFEDHLIADILTQAEPYGPILLDRDDIFVSRVLFEFGLFFFLSGLPSVLLSRLFEVDSQVNLTVSSCPPLAISCCLGLLNSNDEKRQNF